MTDERPSCPIVMDGQIRPVGEVATDNPSWHFFVLLVGRFPHAGKPGQGETFLPNARRLA